MASREALFDGRGTTGDQPVFSAVIRPHRSLGRDGFRTLMLVAAAVTALGAIRTVALGFYPIAGFFLVDFVALAIAFRVNYRRARASEEVVLTPVELLLRRVSHRGRTSEWRLNPLWTRLEHVADEDFGSQRLTLVSRGQSLQVARELSPHERAHFADEFGRALARVKKGL